MTDDKPKILIVDDETFYIDVLVSILREEYQIRVAKTGLHGLNIARGTYEPDLILLDILMPDINGYEVCKQLKEDPATTEIPIIFLTIKSEVDDEVRGFKMGAVDYITKPISPPIVQSRVKNHLVLGKARHVLQNQNNVLEERVKQRTEEIERTQNVAILCLASLAETRDNETGNHIKRTQHYVRLLAEYLKDNIDYKDYLTEETIELLFKSAPLHDIGKVGIPDRILLKPDRLNEEEWKEMKLHAEYGCNALLRAEENMGSTTFLHIAREIALTHHERWDGTGYPKGLSGNDIPIAGRLMALADVYDALISERVYKKAFPHQKAVELITEGKGSQFDPTIVEAFETLQQQFEEIATKFSD